MNVLSVHHRPWMWLLREMTVIAVLSMSIWLVAATGNGWFQLLAVIALASIIVTLLMRLVADILVVGFCGWLAAMGRGLGELVGAIRLAWRKR